MASDDQVKPVGWVLVMVATAGASWYADYSDLDDNCNRSSMAIGFRPQAIPPYPNGQQEVAVQIMVFRGLDTTGRIASGLVQSVNATGGVLRPRLSLTDCLLLSWVHPSR